MTADEKTVKAAETRARKEAEYLAAITGPRAGTGAYMAVGGTASPDVTAPERSLAGIELGELVERKVDWFHPDPENSEFETLKDKQHGYWENLRREIGKAGVLTPLVAMPDGLLVQGHSRLKVAQELGFTKLPVLLILSTLTHEEIRTRRRMDNLTRFEVDEDTRLMMFAEEWPEFYLKQGTPGRKSDHGDPIATASDIAVKTGLSEVKVKRDRSLAAIASRIAKGAGKARPGIAEYKAARESKNSDRRHVVAKPPVGQVNTPSKNTPEVAAADALRQWYSAGSEDYRKGLQQTLMALEMYHVISRASYETVLALSMRPAKGDSNSVALQ